MLGIKMPAQTVKWSGLISIGVKPDCCRDDVDTLWTSNSNGGKHFVPPILKSERER